jgi:NAD(P)-dependent dehydrogenase (short-subunit alcohol dehydrogenase family)
MTDEWTAPDLGGQVAVVTGASRGVGRGIAEVLGACGATVYLVARGDMAEVAATIEANGGRPVGVTCDVGNDRAVAALFDRVGDEQGRLDILVNNAVAWGDHGSDHDTISEPWLAQPPWNAPETWWNSNFAVGVRSHYVATNAAAPLLIAGRRGVVVFTSERQPGEPGMQELVMDLRATVIARMAMLYSLHLRPYRVSSILLYPGFSRTEPIEEAFRRGDASFDGWTADDFAERTASVHYAGRAVASLAADSALLDRTGTLVTSYEAAVRYGFTDTNGRRPDPS